jgi:hypothetical protein
MSKMFWSLRGLNRAHRRPRLETPQRASTRASSHVQQRMISLFSSTSVSSLIDELVRRVRVGGSQGINIVYDIFLKINLHHSNDVR